MKEDIKNEIVSTAIIAAEKIIEKNLDSKNNQKMVEELIENLKK